MNRIIMDLRIELLSDAIFSSGNSVPGGEDITLRTDSQGLPYLPGATFKGLLRQALRDYMCWSGCGTQADIDELLGVEGTSGMESHRRLIFSDLRLERQPERESDWSYRRTFTKLDNGVIKNGTLHSAACLRQGLVLTGLVLCDEGDAALLGRAVRTIQWIGLKRNRGFGHVRICAQPAAQVQAAAAVGSSCWLRYRLRLQTPMAITQGAVDAADEDRRNYAEGRDYIPGSAVRGMVMSYLSKADPQWFAAHKAELLQRVVFRNALPLHDGHVQIPMPMGFYENREKTQFYSVLQQNVVAGHKRARLGRYCRLENGMIHHSTPTMEKSLRITLDPENRQMFTMETMAAGQELEGYIHIPDPDMAPRIAQAFRRWIWLGADRYAGCGLCSVEVLDDAMPDYSAFSYRPGDLIPATLYMLVMSPTALYRDGDVCDLTDDELAGLLGVSWARIDRCATAITKCAGFNRTWGCASPTVSMYDAGSIFRIVCSEIPDADRLRELELHGIGIRRPEGCGQIMFLRDFAGIRDYVRNEIHSVAATDDIHRRQARCRWLLNNRLPEGLSLSQLGNIQELCEDILADNRDFDDLERFFINNSQNRGVDFASKFIPTRNCIQKLLDTSLAVTLGCPEFEHTKKERLKLICDWIDLSRKEEGR